MAAIVIRNLPNEVLASLKSRAKQNGRSMEAEAREVLTLAASQIESKRTKFGTELKEIGRKLGGLELKIHRDLTPGKAADFS